MVYSDILRTCAKRKWAERERVEKVTVSQKLSQLQPHRHFRILTNQMRVANYNIPIFSIGKYTTLNPSLEKVYTSTDWALRMQKRSTN